MKNIKLWRGLSAVFAWLLVVIMAGTSCAFNYEHVINDRLQIKSSVIVGGESINYYTSEFGDFRDADGNFNVANHEKLQAATVEHSINEMEEGAVLFKNENDALPLKSDERRVTFFGHASVDTLYRCGSAGNKPSEPNMKTLEGAFKDAGFEINEVVWNAYKNGTAQRKVSMTASDNDIGEEDISLFTNDIKESWESDYNQVAFIVLARQSAEGNDFVMNDKEGISQLALHKNERDLIEMVTKSGKFGKVIVLLNTPAPMDCDFIDEYDIDACLWFGTPGQWGMTGVVNLLVGKANPSGKTIDTWAANSLSAPATVNSGTETPKWANADTVDSKLEDKMDQIGYVNTQVEGIYVGYKYYETRYEDLILSQGNASASVGSIDGKAWDYAKEMCYPFGYGLSYTEFSQTLDSVVDNGDGTMTIKVTVKNIGSVAGKSVVQLYAQTPYGDYEKKNLVEKSAISLVAYEKSNLLQAGESQTIEIVLDKYLLASYDYVLEKGYIMSEGNYYLAIGENAHDALNNVLAAKGATNLVDEKGRSVSGNKENVYAWSEEFDNTTYNLSKYTNAEVTNRLDDCNLNYWIGDGVTYVSRQDWENTFPTEKTVPTATDEMITQLNGELYEKDEDGIKARDITQGERKGITLIQLKGLSYDDPLWEEYLNQFTIDELATQMGSGFGTKAIDFVVKPETHDGDGIDSVKGRPEETKVMNCCYPALVVCASSWNHDLMTRRGEIMGEEALWSGFFVTFSVGSDLHRTPFGGRNFEYFSEDGNFGYYASADVVRGFAEKGVVAAPKHLAFNDQEYHREGVATLFNEQAARETSLRVFEGAIAVAKTKAFMQGLNRVGLVYSSGNKNLMTGIVREEWGFEGFAETDGLNSTPYQNRFSDAVLAGTDVYCLDSNAKSGKTIALRILKNDDGEQLLALRRAVKNLHFAVVNSCAMNGISLDTQVKMVTPWWKTALIAVDCVLALATIGSVAMMALCLFNKKPCEEKEGGNNNE